MTLTARQLLGRRRTFFLVAVALLPVLIAVAYRAGNDSSKPDDFTVNVLIDGLIVTILLPLAALVIGTSVLGAEFEDGTAIYMLAQPISRRTIVASKLVVAAAVTAVLLLITTAASVIVAMHGIGAEGILPAFSVAVVAGSVVYCALFLFLSILTSRAFVTGLVYVFVWEGLVTGLFTGTRVLSVREYTMGIGGALANVPANIFSAQLGGAEATILMVAAGVIAFLLAVRRLARWEIGESS
jgi:ABC-2 type transport system permease protein